jgi:hypothetical protein
MNKQEQLSSSENLLAFLLYGSENPLAFQLYSSENPLAFQLYCSLHKSAVYIRNESKCG